MLQTGLSSVLGVLFILVGAFNVWLIFHATSRLKDRNASARLIRGHRIGGYIFIMLFCVMVYFMILRLKDVPDEGRTARFVCMLALANKRGQIVLTARDSVAGRIIQEPRGDHGFGYDPLFLIESVGKTTAELAPDDKNAISHRGKALRRMKELMERADLM